MTDAFHALQAEARTAGLMVMGGFHPAADDGAPPGTGTLVMLGPDPAAFWPAFTASGEYADGAPDPLDRWSARVIGAIARAHDARAVFPFGGPPHAPFLAWARRTGRAWVSPVGLLVHDAAGLFVSYRGALALPARLDLPPPPANAPCADCPDQPCRSACPVGALTPAGYDVPACKAHVTAPEGADCMTRGCAVRRACPVSRAHGRVEAQSAFHMAAFA